MKKKIFYAVFLILWSLVLNVIDKDKIEIGLNLIIAILICILCEIMDMNNKKEGN